VGISAVQNSKAQRSNGRWEGYGRLQSALVDSLAKIGKPFFSRLAGMVEQCHQRFSAHRCSRGHQWAVTRFSCKCRLCPFEMRARAMAAVHKFKSIIEGFEQPKYLVLTVKNCATGELRSGIDDLFDAFKRLRHSALWVEVRGALAVLEVTFNKESRTWHPHLNVVFDGPYIPQAELSAVWERSTGGCGRITWIQRADSRTVFELLKYILKLVDIVDDPEAVESFLTATRGKRFIRTYGSLYGLKVEEDVDRDCEEERGEVCPDCGTREVEELHISLRRDDTYFDDLGIVRFCLPVRSCDG
jgi:predicted nucleic-acid-binding Zn-ribbon protein